MKTPVKHWEDMIAWVEGQPENNRVDILIMRNHIGETWQSGYCSYCAFNYLYNCMGCPLVQAGHKCETDGSLWRKLHGALTWREWLIHAKQLLLILREIE